MARKLSTTSEAFAAQLADLLASRHESTGNVAGDVTAIIHDVKARGDAAIIDYTTRFDRLTACG